MSIQAIRGMNDILPEETPWWQHAEHVFKRVFQGYGYQEIRFPIVERTELFKRSIGEVTDIVEKEMYTFLDRNEDSMTLRPEGTASCVRAGLEHGLLYNQIQRFWYSGPYFRYERPQKGRYRQFHQCSAEVFGLVGPDIDAEMIMLSATILEKLGLKKMVQLQLNTLGSTEARQRYRKVLIAYFESNEKHLDEDSKRRLHLNPLRILDSKSQDMQKLIENAPKMADYLDDESKEHFKRLQEILTEAKIEFTVNHRLVRGLDYYNKTVFEWVTEELGAQGTVCGGGRYDGLVAQLGGKATPAIGFSFGMERSILLMKKSKKNYPVNPTLHAYLITDDQHFADGLLLANRIRSKIPLLRIVIHCGGGDLKAQLRKADKSKALYALILGSHEIKNHTVTIKPLRDSNASQQALFFDEVVEYLKLAQRNPTSTTDSGSNST